LAFLPSQLGAYILRTADMIKSKYWRARDLQGQPPIVLTIADVTEELLGRGGHQDVKCFLWFSEHMKGLQLNKVRVTTLEAAFGPDSELWVGKRVRLSFDPTVEFGGRAVGGVRLQTPPGIVFSPGAGLAGWGEGPGSPTAPPGAPPPPVWDAKRQTWVTQAPIAAPAPSQPPPPVWNAATQSWDVVNPSTGEIHRPVPAKDPLMGGAPTISQRIAAGAPKNEWTNSENPAPAGALEFDDDIPF
jgi:hypothetical protein